MTDCIADYHAKSSERYPLLANRFITESAPLSLSGCCCSNANPLSHCSPMQCFSEGFQQTLTRKTSPKVVNFHFTHSKLGQQPFLLKN